MSCHVCLKILRGNDVNVYGTEMGPCGGTVSDSVAPQNTWRRKNSRQSTQAFWNDLYTFSCSSIICLEKPSQHLLGLAWPWQWYVHCSCLYGEENLEGVLWLQGEWTIHTWDTRWTLEQLSNIPNAEHFGPEKQPLPQLSKDLLSFWFVSNLGFLHYKVIELFVILPGESEILASLH